ncbi:MAG: glutamate--tRNA ligase [Hyphomonadaceae bacterium]
MTQPIVRFAPSPTGRIHVGNVRTALINWLFAQKLGGAFILRIDDTDTARSTKVFEDGIKTDLEWLGLTWASTFNQSDRFADYDAAAETLKAAGLLYPCYETSDELDRKRKIALSRGRPPVYDRAALELSDSDRAKLEAEGRTAHWRFKLSGERAEWTDLVRGDQSIDTSSLSDPILIRGDGSYLYTLPSVVDDIEAKVTYVVRGEDHVTNSGAQIEIFRALGGTSPEMAHTPLLIGADGQGLSKRLGSLSIAQLANDGFEPMAITSLLAKIGTSDNVEARGSLDELAREFDFGKIGRSPARFDEDELKGLNAAILHEMSFEDARDRLTAIDPRAAETPLFWETVRANCEVLPDAAKWLDVAFGEIAQVIEDEDRDFIAEAGKHLPDGAITSETWGAWTSALKAETGRKGKGLFMPLRLALTGQKQGPDMASMLQLIGRDRALARLSV